MHCRAFLLLLFPATLGALPLSGEYHFVHLFLREAAAGEPRITRNLGGTVVFDPGGRFRYRAFGGTDRDAAAEQEGTGQWRWNAAANCVILTNPAHPELDLTVRIGDGETALLGSTADARVHDLFVAARAPSAENPAILRGEYGAAYFLVGNAEGAGIVTAFLDLTADGRSRFTATHLVGHAAGIDDVNRAEQTSDSTFSIRADGSGSAFFASPSDALSGERRLLVAGSGDIVFGFGVEAGQRDILVAVRKQTDVSTLSFGGLYWIAEIGAEGEFVYQPEAMRLSSAAGVLRATGEGAAYIAERVHHNGRITDLSTVNTYRIWAAGDFLGSRLTTGLHNFSLGANGLTFVGAQVGRAADLTLEHGVFFGIRAATSPPRVGVYLSPFGALHAAAPVVPASPLAPGTAYSVYGSNLAAVTRATSASDLPSTLAGVRVLINGDPAGLFSISPSQINLRAPDSLATPVVFIQVDNNGSLSNAIEVPVASTAPGVFSITQTGTGSALVTHADFSLVTPAAPARPGETVIVFAAGLGAVTEIPGSGLSAVTDPGLRVLFDAVPGEISFAGLVPGFAGLYQINVAVPEVASAAPVNLAVVTSGAVSDLTEIPVR